MFPETMDLDHNSYHLLMENAEMLKSCFGANGLGGVVNNSRGILCAYKKNGGTYYDAARSACIAMQKDLSSAIGKMSK